MSEIKDVSGTAFVVAEFRAEENREATPLYRDSVVGLFLSEESRHAAARVAASFPPVKDLVKIRTKYFDDMLEKHIALAFPAGRHPGRRPGHSRGEEAGGRRDVFRDRRCGHADVEADLL